VRTGAYVDNRRTTVRCRIEEDRQEGVHLPIQRYSKEPELAAGVCDRADEWLNYGVVDGRRVHGLRALQGYGFSVDKHRQGVPLADLIKSMQRGLQQVVAASETVSRPGVEHRFDRVDERSWH
jgi:hypothetical protein